MIAGRTRTRAVGLSIAWAAGSLLWIGVALAAPPPAPSCAVPEDLEYTEVSLPHLAAGLRRDQPIIIAVIGSGSSTGAGTIDRTAYPERLVGELGRRFPAAHFTVKNFSKRGQLASEMVARLKPEVLAEKPLLVIWQTGTVDAVRNVDLDSFFATLEAGVETIAAQGADAVLMNMQYSPHTSGLLNIEPYRERMQWVAQSHSVILFDRFDMMKYWEEESAIDFSDPSKAEQARADDFVQGCIARLLAEMIEAAVKPSGEAAQPQ